MLLKIRENNLRPTNCRIKQNNRLSSLFGSPLNGLATSRLSRGQTSEKKMQSASKFQPLLLWVDRWKCFSKFDSGSTLYYISSRCMPICTLSFVIFDTFWRPINGGKLDTPETYPILIVNVPVFCARDFIDSPSTSTVFKIKKYSKTPRNPKTGRVLLSRTKTLRTRFPLDNFPSNNRELRLLWRTAMGFNRSFLNAGPDTRKH